MKKLKFISFLVAVVLMATSLTSCLSNGDSTRTGYNYVYITRSMGTVSIKSLDGKITFQASNAQAIPSNVEGLCVISYNVLTTDNSNSGSTSSLIPIELTGLQKYDNAQVYPIPESSFDPADTLTTSTNKWQEGSFINVIGYDLYSSNNPDFSATTSYEFPVDKFGAAPNNPRLILGLNYGTALISSTKLAPHAFFLTYDEKNPIKDGTLTLTLKHYIATKDITSPNSMNVVPSIKTDYSQVFYAFDLSRLVNGGNFPSKIIIKINKDDRGWIKDTTTKEIELTGSSSLVEGVKTNTTK